MKIKRLADGGEFHEAANAKAHLEALLKKYGMTIADLGEEEKTVRTFKYGNQFEMEMLVMHLTAVIGPERTCGSSYNQSKKEVYTELTAYEYAEVRSMHEWHCRNFASEKRRMLKNIQNAYILKHNLCAAVPTTERREPTEASRKMYLDALELSRTLNDVYYHKQLEKGNEPDR